MSLPAVAIALTVFSGVTQAIGAINQGKAEADAANRAAQIAERNKVYINQDRINAARANELDLEDQRREHRRQIASIRANYGSSGLDIAGSPLDILADTSIEQALDERRVEYRGSQENRAYSLKMVGATEEADAELARAKNAKIAGSNRAMGFLLSSGSQAAGQGYEFYG